MFKRILLGVLAAALLAAPAAAGDGNRKGHRGHKSYRHSGHGYSGHAAYRGHGHGHHVSRSYRYYGGRYRYYDDDAFLWLGVTALGVKALDVFNDELQRRYEAAHRQAATAPVGQSIEWTSGSSRVAVTPVREGYDSSGNLCREFQQEIRVGGRTERGWGTACLQQDGSWKMAN